MKKRLLSAILSFCMLLTMAPTVAFAASNGVKTEAELRTAIIIEYRSEIQVSN